MGVRRLGACLLIAAAFFAGAAASASHDVPRFSLSATTASPDDQVALRVEQSPGLPQRELRLYLVPTGVAPAVRSRLDSRLSFIGSVRALRGTRLVFTVPPLELGSYALAYWCRGCLPPGQAVGVQASPTFRINAAAGEGCLTTKPNRHARPRGVPTYSGFQWHGNGGLWAFFRPDGSLVTNHLGGYKMLWVAREGLSGHLRVQYRMLDPPSAPLTARTGWLTGYDRPNWTMSQMGFEPGCWQITGRLGDVSLSFVVQVVRP